MIHRKPRHRCARDNYFSMNHEILHLPAAQAAAQREQLGPYAIETLIPARRK